MNRIDLENRLIDFAVLIIKISGILPKTRAGNTLANQIVRARHRRLIMARLRAPNQKEISRTNSK